MKPTVGAPLLFFSDLDGTLLDHESYSYEPALEALDLLRDNGIPLILASSKTAAEIEPLRSELGFDQCDAIVENGSGILTAGTPKELSNVTYLKLIDEIADAYPASQEKFRGFFEISVDELADLTGLSQQNAALAKQRRFSEPGIWSGTKDEFLDFTSALKDRGIVVQRGGRFTTLSYGGNKAICMKSIQDKHSRDHPNCFSIALGDAPNDIEMLLAADLGIIVANPSHGGIEELAEEKTGKILRTSQPGPIGWNEAVLKVLSNAGVGGKIG